MNPLASDARSYRVEAAKRFAAQFNELEWKYLCSYQWFLAGVSRGLDSGDFFPIQARAEEALVDGKIRKHAPVLGGHASTSSWRFTFF